MLKGLIMALIVLGFSAISRAIGGRRKGKDEWVCPKCSHRNSSDKQNCENCGEEKK